MMKTYLYLEPELDNKIKQTAQMLNLSKAKVMRQALTKGINEINTNNKESINFMFKVAELAKRNKVVGNKNSSKDIDKLLWGTK